MAPGLDCIIVK